MVVVQLTKLYFLFRMEMCYFLQIWYISHKFCFETEKKYDELEFLLFTISIKPEET